MQNIIQNNIEAIRELCQSHHIIKLYAFGSVTGNDFTSKSDIDLLYEMDYSGFDFDKLEDCPFDPYTEYFTLKEDLEKLLNRRVDLIPNHDFRNKYFKKTVEESKILLYSNERHKKISA